MHLPLLSRSIRVGLAVVVTGCILVASVLPVPEGTPLFGPFGLVGLDKWLHAIAYGILAVAVAYAIPARSRRDLVLAVVVAVVVGLLVEVIQLGLPYRTFDLTDGVANAVGATIAAVVWRVLGIGQRLKPVTICSGG